MNEKNKVVLVTGAGGGIGSAVVDCLLKNGFSVFGLDLHDSGISHPDYRFIQTDITSTESTAAACAEVSRHTDALDGIVNTAGIVFMGSLVEEDAELMQKILDVNVSGMARINRVFFPLLEKKKGRIVNFSSEYGIFCSIPFHGYYTASKHAVECYTDSLRRELNYLGMKVIAIRPGAVNTSMTHGTVPAFERIQATTTHFGKTYAILAPLLTGATKHPVAPEVIAGRVLKALTVRHPKRAYNIHQDIRVRILSALPERMIDWIFKVFI